MNGINGDNVDVENKGEANKKRFERSFAMKVLDES